MKQFEQVIDIMRKNGGYATLGFLNQNVNVSEWKTKTPFATIRRIVQDKRFFFKIKPGLWALNDFKSEIINKFNLETKSKEADQFNHTYYQGLLVEIGNLNGYSTYVPQQDKNKLFLERKLGSVAELASIYEFSYSEIVDRARTVDVIWFNNRKLPYSFFEIEHTTDIQNSLLKFFDLQDYYSNFYIVSAKEREREFSKKLKYGAFGDIKERVQFIDYDYVAELHTKTSELNRIRKL